MKVIENMKALTLLILIIILQTGCTKFVQVDPPTTAIASASVYSNNTSAAAAMSSVYSNMIKSYGPGFMASGTGSISYLMGLASDELKNYSEDPTQSQFYTNSLSSRTGSVSNYYFWSELYNDIHVSDAVMEGLSSSTVISPSVKSQLIGEAKFVRAFMQFYATNLYGDAPLVLTTNYLTNNSIHRSSASDVLQQVVSDLKDAEFSLPENFVDGLGNNSGDRIRPNKGAAAALLARAYLYQKKWDSALVEATKVINDNGLYNITSLDSAFLMNNNEAIWQLQSIDKGFNTFDGYNFVLTAAPGASSQVSVSLNNSLINSFEAGDARFTHWVGTFQGDTSNYYYPFKYKIGVYDATLPVTEYTVVLRLAEQFLIRAEARANLGDADGAVSDLNVIRTRAGLTGYTGSTDNSSLLKAILHERQVELFTEWGHRWFDLARTGNLNAVMSIMTPLKGGTWNPDWMLLPVPLNEIQINPNLSQNTGY